MNKFRIFSISYMILALIVVYYSNSPILIGCCLLIALFLQKYIVGARWCPVESQSFYCIAAGIVFGKVIQHISSWELLGIFAGGVILWGAMSQNSFCIEILQKQVTALEENELYNPLKDTESYPWISDAD